MNIIDTLVFLNTPKIGRKTVMKIFTKGLVTKELIDVNSYKNILSKISPKVAESITNETIESAIESAHRIINDADKNSITIICFDDNQYPKALKLLKNDAPPILFIKGNINALENENRIAIIGTRDNSEHGEKAGSVITKEFVKHNYTIVSGLALGCDTIAHEVCIENQGTTIAVLPCGLDSVYPKSNKLLADRILEKGCLISEYPVGTRALNSYFVERDRIQSGLSKGVVIIETKIKGGSIHTSKFCLEQHRVLACVNYKDELNSASNEGNNFLIKEKKAFPLNSNNIDILINQLKNFSKPESKSQKSLFE